MVTAMNESLNGWAQRNAFGAVVVLVIRAIVITMGIVLMAIGAVLAPLPIPLGVPSFLLGLVLVAAASKTAHHFITNQLRRFPWLWKRIRFAFGEKEPAE